MWETKVGGTRASLLCPCLRHRSASHHPAWILLLRSHALPWTLLRDPSTSLPCISAFFSLTFSVWSFPALLNTTVYFVLPLERPEQRRVCAVCIASLLLARIGAADVIREDALEADRECALCFFCMLTMLHATAQVKECSASAAFRILNLCVEAMMKYTLYCQVSSIQGIYHTAVRTRTAYTLHIIFGSEEPCASPYNYQSFV